MYNIIWLKTQYDQNQRLKYLPFWGHQPRHDKRITESCFSQWWDEHPFEIDGVQYPTSEHWMMAVKARMFHDATALKAIMNCESPGEAKKLGRGILNFNPKVWDDHKFEVVVKGNFHKFSQHSALKAFLVGTGSRVIIEASPYDAVWGVGMSKDDKNIENPHLWRGENLLGFALMVVRDQVKD